MRRAMMVKVASGGGPAPTPDVVLGSKLIAWYRRGVGLYDALVGGSSVASDGQEIGRWEDQSGNGYHMVRGTAIGVGHIRWRPGITWGGSGVVEFLGSGFFSIPDALATALAAQGGADLFLGIQSINGDGAWTLGTDGNSTHYPWNGDGHVYDGTFVATRADSGVPPISISSTFRCFNTGAGSGLHSSWIDSTPFLSPTACTVSFRGSGNEFGRSNATYLLNAYVSDIVFCAPRATSPERAAMVAYIQGL